MTDLMEMLAEAGAVARPGPSVWRGRAQVNTCRLCGVPLIRSADTAADEFCWRDPSGSQTGTDHDMAALVPDPYAYLAGLAENLERLHDKRKRRPEGPMRAWGLWKSPAGWFPVMDMGQEYTMLKVRLDLGNTTFHVHQARDDTPDGPGWPLPWHCDWPGWLRPSGWQCRQCGRRLLPLVGGL